MAQEKIRLFKNPILESLTRTDPYSPIIFWSAFIIYLMYRSQAIHLLLWWEYFVLFPAAIIIWTLTEYLLHRFLFHFPDIGPISRRLVFIFHGAHHKNESDPERGLMPVIPAIFHIFLLACIFISILGQRYGESFLAFFIVGYLSYDYFHFLMHQSNPKSQILRNLRKNHLIHHRHPEVFFGVSTPFWDYVFKTAPSKATNRH